MSKTLESPVSSMRLAAGAKATILAIAGGFGGLLAEHSRALRAATKAQLPRKRLTELRALYTAPHAKRRSVAANDRFKRVLESRTMARRLATGLNVVAALGIALGLIALVAV